MRRTYGGNGADTTSATAAYLATAIEPILYDLYIIGPPGDPRALYLTNYPAPVNYPLYGIFYPAVVSRDGVKAQIGLDVTTMAITWAIGSLAPQTVNTNTASPYQLAANHFYDNWPILVLRCFMPTPGDANTLGCAVWFGGRVNNCKIARNSLVFNVNSFLDVVTQKVPSTVIEVTNTLAGTTPVNLPAGDPTVPTFSCITPSTEDFIVADCTGPTAGVIYSGNLFTGGYMVFLSGVGATLAGCWSAIGQNGRYRDESGIYHSEFEIYTPLPWPPTPGVDTFYVSKAPPINLGDPGYSGFPYVPAPQQAV